MFYYYIITTNYFKCHYFKIGITSNYYHYYHYYVLLSGATWRCARPVQYWAYYRPTS